MSVGWHRVIHGDCTIALRDLARDSFLVDAVVTDPPYHLASIVARLGSADAAPIQSGATGAYARASSGFMGQQWDGGDIAFRPETWRRVYDVMKPGAHLVAFSATKGYHRMACAIEDAGFEIRDCLCWHYGTGFPKSHDITKSLREGGSVCTCSDEDHDQLRGLREAEDHAAGVVQADLASDMQSSVQRGLARERVGDARPQGWQGADSGKLCELGTPGICESSMEGWSDPQEAEGQLQGSTLCQGAGMGEAYGAQGWLHHGASACDGQDVRLSSDANGGGQSSGSQSIQQSSKQSGIVADQRGPQTRGSGEICERCRKPTVTEGLGTALKPAVELIVLAQKPISEGSIAANVARWGVGAINIDACRIPVEDAQYARNCSGLRGHDDNRKRSMDFHLAAGKGSDLGRWPANVLHDGSEEVLAAFAAFGERGAAAPVHNRNAPMFGSVYQHYEAPIINPGATFHGDTGTAARFFYSSKATQGERIFECRTCGAHTISKPPCGHDDLRTHPTVKPLSLMQWLVTLICPSGGLVLDPFAGTGTTSAAARAAGMQSLSIEADESHVRDIAVRLGVPANDLIETIVESYPVDHGLQREMFA